MMMTVAPPVVHPSLGLIALMHGVAASENKITSHNRRLNGVNIPAHFVKILVKRMISLPMFYSTVCMPAMPKKKMMNRKSDDRKSSFVFSSFGVCAPLSSIKPLSFFFGLLS